VDNLNESIRFTPEQTKKAKENLLVDVMVFAVERFKNLSPDVMEKNILELKALKDCQEYCKACKGMDECIESGHTLKGELMPNGLIYLSMTQCGRRMPIPGTEVKRTKKNSGYFES
jgi:hypothetical protein